MSLCDVLVHLVQPGHVALPAVPQARPEARPVLPSEVCRHAAEPGLPVEQQTSGAGQDHQVSHSVQVGDGVESEAWSAR